MAGSIIYSVGRVIADLYANELNVPLDQVESFQKYVGGSSANTAVGLARLGDTVGLIGCVGRDPMGDFILKKLTTERIDVRMVRQDARAATGIAFAALFPPSDSAVWFCGVPNANAELRAIDIDQDAARSAAAFVMAGTVFAQEPARSAAFTLLQLAATEGIPVVLDVDWRPVFWSQDTDALAIYDRVLSMASVVLANETELELVGRTTDRDLASRRLLDRGVSEVVAKRGSEGSWYFSRSTRIHVPAFSVKVMNTLGAGDGFAAGYVHGYVAGWPPEERLRWASACGGIVVSRHSCSEAMPTREEVLEFLEMEECEVTRDD